MLTMERHSHKKFWLAIVILGIVAITFLVGAARLSHELNETQNALLMLESELEAVQAQLTDMAVGLADTEIELSASKELIESLEATLYSLQVNYDRLTAGYGYVLRDPSYQEMRDFLKQDETSEQEYVENQYTCVNFAADVKANAVKEGIRCAYIVLEYRGGRGHTIVAFDTTDEGLVFIEPQFDWEAEPEIGKRYYQCVKPPPGYSMSKPAYDDTIVRIIVIW